MVTKIQEFSNSDILITIPKSIKWENYTKELINAENGDIMNFKVPFLPKSSIIGNKCYVVYNGFIRGYMIISGVINDTSFDCTTTGDNWSGKFIQRTGKFYYLDKLIPYKGFQGWRYFDLNKNI